MKILGVDPSSTLGGLAIVEDGEPVCVDHWKKDKRGSHPDNLLGWFRYVDGFIGIWQPQMAAIEMHSYSGVKSNDISAHAVGYYQGVAALVCKLRGLVVLEIRASTSRSIVLGNGSLSKDAAWEIMRKRYPELFSAKTGGGLDEMDAVTCAQAAPTAAER